jgi:antitoxin component YwqK of YwqJK toxin-antitoxin module
MKKWLLILIGLLLFCGCKNQAVNQIVSKKREGFWIEKYTDDSLKYQSRGFYKKGNPIKKWKYFLNGQLLKKEKFKSNYCQTRVYYQNGKLASKGKTNLDSINQNFHWYYNGIWKFYNEKGKLSTLREYKNGDLISEIEIK